MAGTAALYSSMLKPNSACCVALHTGTLSVRPWHLHEAAAKLYPVTEREHA